MKKTDLVKGLAKKLEGRMKTVGVPDRFAQGAAAMASQRTARNASTAPAVPKLVPLPCRLPADLVNRLRERVTSQGDGASVNTLIALALTQYLDATDVPKPA